MAAAQVAGTPAATEAAPSAESHGIDSILGDLSDVAEADGGDGGEGILDALAGEGATPEAETSPEPPPDKAQRLDDEVIFSKEALSTKEGIEKARARTLELRKLQHEKYLELKNFEKRVAKRHEKLRHQVDKYVANKRNDDLLLGNVRSNLQALHSNDPNAIITALGNLTGQDGLKAYELITSHIVNRGPSKLDPQVQAMLDAQRQEIEELKQGFVARDTQAKVHQLTGQIEQHKHAIGQRITTEASQLPHLARLYSENPQNVVDYIVEEIETAHASGRPVDGRQYFSNLEAQLARHFNPGQAAKADGGGPAPKQPAPAQRSPGQSIGPRSAAPSTQRVPSEEESLRALAQDDQLMSQFGF